MSKVLAHQDATDTVVLRGPNQSVITISNKTSPRYDTSTGVPQNSVAGFMPGAIVINPYGSAGSFVYVNQGTATSSSFLNLA